MCIILKIFIVIFLRLWYVKLTFIKESYIIKRNPEKNSPRMFDLATVKNGLSEKQLSKIQYECDLLRIDLQNETHRAVAIIPFLFQEGITAANTKVIKEIISEPEDKPHIWTYNTNHQSYSNDDYDE